MGDYKDVKSPTATLTVRVPATEEECMMAGWYWYDNACHRCPEGYVWSKEEQACVPGKEVPYGLIGAGVLSAAALGYVLTKEKK